MLQNKSIAEEDEKISEEIELGAKTVLKFREFPKNIPLLLISCPFNNVILEEI